MTVDLSADDAEQLTELVKQKLCLGLEDRYHVAIARELLVKVDRIHRDQVEQAIASLNNRQS